MRPDLLRWQWEGYPQFHGSRRNLIIHLFAVPAFVLSLFYASWCAAHLAWAGALAGLGGMAVAFGAQAIGHQDEKNPSIPFAGPADALSRIFVENLVTFPRFLLGGGWFKAYRRG